MNLIRTLVGLYISLAMLPLSIISLNYISNMQFDYDQINDEISIAQLREILLISYDLNISNNQIDFIYQNKPFRLSLVNNFLILQPGTQIYLNNIDDLYFEQKNDCLYLCYEKNNKLYEKVIASTKGIYLEYFSDCPIDSEPSSDLSE